MFLFQSTLPRGERLTRRGLTGNGAEVSIHAPAWGATRSAKRSSASTMFQSTLPRGERRDRQSALRRQQCFNPRSRVGSDFGQILVRPCGQVFQSTLPRGERRFEMPLRLCRFGVSIHAPAWGATVQVQAFCQRREVSIHAPAWGATLLW